MKRKKKKKKREEEEEEERKNKAHSGTYLCPPPPLALVFMLERVRGFLGTEEPRFIFTETSETKTQTCESE